MTNSQTATLNHMYEEACAWIRGIDDLTGAPDKQASYHALRGALFALRDRLPINDLFDLSAQLPTVIRGIMFEGYSPSNKPEKLDRAQFLQRIESELQASQTHQSPAEAAQAVFAVMNSRLSPGAMNALKQLLPDDFAEFWETP